MADSSVLLVLDVNGLLLDRRRAPLPERLPDLVTASTYVYLRPFAREFCAWTLQHFRVGVWSSASERNLVPLVNALFGHLAHQLEFVWGQAQCDTLGVCPGTRGKPMFTKSLQRVWDRGLGHPRRTLLVDDDKYKARVNPDHTALLPPKGDAAAPDRVLAYEGKLRWLLSGVAGCIEVPSFLRSCSEH